MKVSEHTLQQLYQFIEQQNLQSGQRLPAERTLAELLNVSRSSLREALQQLASLGVIISKAGSGNYLQYLPNDWAKTGIVRPIEALLEQDPEYRFDVQEARIVLEGGTAWYAALRATPSDLLRIRRCYDEIVRHQINGDSHQASIADAEFHLAIADASHNAVLIQMMRTLFDLLQYNVVLARKKIYNVAKSADQLAEQHLAVMRAIERGDAALAKQLVCEHIDYVVEHIRELDLHEARQKRATRLLRTD
ncbi:MULTISPECIES: transcriptional regulator LldR [unclassified Acinetobacter]|uniref:transcriptional regulator LldR n=1 Tax=unclassified Acinetobacter TaxID=196816 RepID=UPI0035B7F9FB